jgi:hypothetical protein
VRRKVLGGLVLALGTALALTGCGKPAGTDGNLTNGWAMLPEAKIAVPTAPACYTATEEDLTTITKWPAPVDCTSSHNVELIHVGQFTGSDADNTSGAPASGSSGRRKAYEECAEKAKEFLGADWREGRLELTLDVPIPQQWEAGARWYRCDLQEYKDLEDYAVATRFTSLKGALSGDKSEPRIGCLTITEAGSEIDKMLPIACTSPHNGEFAGVWEAPDGTYNPDAAARRAANLAGCRGVVSAYAGIPNDSNFTYRTGQVTTPFNKASWELGNRGVRCYIWLNKNVSNSLKGVGTGGLPINYG